MTPARGRLKSGGVAEAPFQAAVIGLAGFYGWRHYHPPDNAPSAGGRRQSVKRGFPDLTLLRVDLEVRSAELVFAELKSDEGVLSPAQREWMAELEVLADRVREAFSAVLYAAVRPSPALEVDAYVWRPRDWDAIERRLSAGRHRVPMPAPT